MRQVVLPGMAKLMHRPLTTSPESYGFNRSQRGRRLLSTGLLVE
jgi:hypothetical protein